MFWRDASGIGPLSILQAISFIYIHIDQNGGDVICPLGTG